MSRCNRQDRVLLLVLLAVATAEFLLNVNRPYATGIFVGRYSLNIDAPEWLDAIRGFPDLGVRQNRPLYPLIGHVLSAACPFVALLTLLRATNLLLIYLMLYFFYESLLSVTDNRRVIFCAVFLLATAPAINIYGPQPVPEILTFFSIALLCYLAARFNMRGLNIPRVILFALVHGVVLLIKENVALVLFFFVLLVWIRHYRYAVLYLLVVPLPYVLWMTIVRSILHAPFTIDGVEHYGFVTWLLRDLAPAGLREQIRYSVHSAARFGWHVLKAFVFVPVVLSLVGLAASRVRGKWVLYGAYCGAYFIMFFAMNLISPRMAFMLYPVIVFFAAEGWYHIVLRGHAPSRSRDIAFLLPLVLFALLTSLDIYRLYNYG
jgi:hypothetical protein